MIVTAVQAPTEFELGLSFASILIILFSGLGWWVGVEIEVNVTSAKVEVEVEAELGKKFAQKRWNHALTPRYG